MKSSCHTSEISLSQNLPESLTRKENAETGIVGIGAPPFSCAWQLSAGLGLCWWSLTMYAGV
jgi:hypothetical protein